ncbi:MAG: helix-turn-helix transcriptional regulator [Comamonas sp.]
MEKPSTDHIKYLDSDLRTVATPQRSGIGLRLKSARLAAGMTQLTVAMSLGFARSSISMIENESRPLRPDELDSFAKLYGVEVASLEVG